MFKDNAEFFGAILKNPKLIEFIPQEYKNNIDFFETLYIILGDEIKPYISIKIYNYLHKKYNQTPITDIIYDSEEELEIALLYDITLIDKISTNEKYTSEFIEFMYLIWGDELKDYIPYEMYEELDNENKMKAYHLEYKMRYQK